VLLVGDPAFRDEDRRDMEREAKSPRSGRDEVGGREIAATTRSTGDGAALSGLRRLARSRDEVVSIGRCFASATILLGPEASEQRLMQLATAGELARYRVIHLATHARVDDLRPERSFLVLSRVGLPDPSRAAARGERSYDGLLRVQEMLEEWTLDADLVSLSACETALGKRIDGEGYVGFAQALFRVGARSLLASLWRVEDAATEKLMTRFYQNLTGSYSDARGGPPGQRMSKAAALGEAKAWLRETAGRRGTRPYAHPFFWSAFVLMGDPGGLR
jgi:CHAT domain-containing protein